MLTRRLLQCSLCRGDEDGYWQAVTSAQCCRPCVWSVRDTLKFDRGLTSLLHDELHWLDVPERVTYKTGVMVYSCLHGQAPRYLADHLVTSSNVASRLRLRSANRHQLIVPCCRLNSNTYGRAFSIAGPTLWNSLPDELRDPTCGSDSFKQFIKTILFSLY